MTYFLGILIFFIFYTYFGYPVLLLVLGKLFPKRVTKAPITPTVSFIIAAYNEQKDIESKIKNTLELDYPSDKMEIIVVSDGSTDRTDEIVKQYASSNVKLFRVEGRVGKTEARNQAVLSSTQEIIVFSDATTHYHPNAVKALVQNFADQEVGMVSGHLAYFEQNNTKVGMATRMYWKYETLIKEAQSSLGTLTEAVGCINAFRRKLYTPLPANIIEDFTVPLCIVSKGYRVVFEKDAMAYEKTTEKVSQEFSMRVRVIRGGMTATIFAIRDLKLFKRIRPSFQLIGHKILRWLVPVFAVPALFISAILSITDTNIIYDLLFAGQALFYITALGAYLLEMGNINSKFLKILNFPLYFCVVNTASLVAMSKVFTSELEATWNTDR